MVPSRVSVIGASGFIGRYVVKRLAARGATVVAIGRNTDRALLLQPMGDVGQIARVAASITDEARLAKALASADAVVNLAGILYEHGRQSFTAVHRDGAGRVGRLAKAAGVKHLVHLSALGASAESPAAYAISKAAGERAVTEAFPGAVILRPSIVFGPEDAFFNRFASLAALPPWTLPLIGGGATRFQPVYVGDVADAVLAALDTPSCAGHIYELGGPRTYTFKELMRLVLAETHRRAWLVPVPWSIARLQGSLLGLLRFFGTPPLTLDQVRMLERDNVVSAGSSGLAELGITPTAAEAVLPSYLDRYRRGGWFSSHRMEV